MKYFSYSPDSGMTRHETAEEAKAAAEAEIQYYRENAEAGDGWPEEDVEQVTWGEIRQETRVISREPAPEGSDFDFYYEYGLRNVE